MLNYPLCKPDYNNLEFDAVKQVMESGWIIDGDKVRDFEKLISEYTGAKYAIATSSCTTALITLLKYIASKKQGGSVIVPAFGWIATANAVISAGLTPIFVDVDCNSNIDVTLVERSIQDDTIGIIAVHNCGILSDILEIDKIAKKHGLFVIEDAACSLGVKVNNTHTGLFGIAGCFSFHPRKIITTGEGGMIITNCDELYTYCKSYINHGAALSPIDSQNSGLLPEFNITGSNFRMTNIQGAIGCVQMAKLSSFIERRKEIVEQYKSILDGLDLTYFNSQNYSTFGCMLKNESSNLITYLVSKSIQSRQLSHSAPLQNCYGYSSDLFPMASQLDKKSFTLPLYHQLQPWDIIYIATEVRNFILGYV